MNNIKPECKYENKQQTVVHLIFRFDIGGLERVMVNCINAMQNYDYKHIVIALTDVSDFSTHLHENVEVYQLNKKSGKDLASHWRLFKLLRTIKPDILHTYNLAAIEYHPVARLAGVKGHIHAEHGREISDPEGLNSKHNLLRKLISPFIDYFVPVSTDLDSWLKNIVKIPARKVKLIRNGINTQAFNLTKVTDNAVRFIHIARFNPVKDQANLLRAFALLVNNHSLKSTEVNLTMVGDGELMTSLKNLTTELSLNEYVQFTGARNDIAELLASADIFVLSSIAEGIPMTVLEAMSSGLPIISTRVGGLPELIEQGINGYLVEKENTAALAEAMHHYVDDKNKIIDHGSKGQLIIAQKFEESAVVQAYLALYQKSLGL
jgi:sugar transferase (PEP-CTERM/EpsH1 system associated)